MDGFKSWKMTTRIEAIYLDAKARNRVRKTGTTLSVWT